MNEALQIERLAAGTVETNATVVFDSTTVLTGNIDYDSVTGVVTLNEPGRYEFDWWVATQSSASTNGAGFVLVSSQGDSVIGNSPIKTGEVVGVAVIEVESAPVKVELRNNSTATVFYSTTVPVKASLAIIGEPGGGETGPTGPTGPQGPQGEIGPTGPTGPGSIRHSGVIPFSIQDGDVGVSTDDQGNPSIIQFAGFEANAIVPGSGEPTQLQPGDWAAGTITFNVSNYTRFYRCTFVMPYDAVVKNMYVLFGAKMSVFLEAGVSLYPFASLAVLTSDTPGQTTGEMIFTLLQNTITYSDPFIAPEGGGQVPKYTLVRGSRTDINDTIPAGSLVGIIVGIRAEGITAETSTRFSVSGGILLE